MLFNNIDTDQIIPSREMKKVSKNGLGEGLFAGQRYLPSFILNVEPFNQATILLSCQNFGCGSSREHAAWALREFGFKIIIAESFGTIFRTNCLRNGIVPITLEAQQIDHLYQQVIANPVQNKIHVDVTKKIVVSPDSQQYSFELESHFQEMLVDGLDFISLTMKRKQKIAEFIERDKKNRPWAQL
ncbi:UNVERIFIED_CONTAM: hypothetical protein GTU68_012584 [Idotea baltica]|nr:hypothetical protein [Idotea baltica]